MTRLILVYNCRLKYIGLHYIGYTIYLLAYYVTQQTLSRLRAFSFISAFCCVRGISGLFVKTMQGWV